MNTLLAVDGSDNAYEAVRALKHFRRADTLTLLHVLDVPRPAYPMMVPEVAEELYRTVEKGMREEGQRLLNHVASLLPAGAGPAHKRLEVGSPAELILKEADQGKVDLILMGSRGIGPVKEQLFGSVSHRVLTLASAATGIISAPLKALNRVLLPLQGPDDAEAAVKFLGTKPFRGDVELVLFTVFPTTSTPWPLDPGMAISMEQQGLDSAKEFLTVTASKLIPLGYKTRTLAVPGVPTGMIMREAEKMRPDLIAMGTHGRKGLSRFVYGSVSHALLHSARYPILVYR
jgi:nucleotide-binding universal stress UspA family protein